MPIPDPDTSKAPANCGAPWRWAGAGVILAIPELRAYVVRHPVEQRARERLKQCEQALNDASKFAPDLPPGVKR